MELWVESPCEHGDVEPHGIGINARIAGRIDCQGGERHEASPAELVAALEDLVRKGELSPTVFLAAVKTLDGVEEVETRPFGGKGLIEVEERGTYLVVPVALAGRVVVPSRTSEASAASDVAEATSTTEGTPE